MRVLAVTLDAVFAMLLGWLVWFGGWVLALTFACMLWMY